MSRTGSLLPLLAPMRTKEDFLSARYPRRNWPRHPGYVSELVPGDVIGTDVVTLGPRPETREKRVAPAPYVRGIRIRHFSPHSAGRRHHVRLSHELPRQLSRRRFDYPNQAGGPQLPRYSYANTRRQERPGVFLRMRGGNRTVAVFKDLHPLRHIVGPGLVTGISAPTTPIGATRYLSGFEIMNSRISVTRSL